MRKIIILLSLPVFFLYYSCSKDDIVIPEKTLLKIKYWYPSINDTVPTRIYEYQYDNEMKLERIYHYHGNRPDTAYGYELFEYTMNNELVNKNTYHYCCDSLGWLLSDSTHYGYENGKLILEEIYYPPPNPYQVSFQYQYDNSEVIKKCRYDKKELLYCTKYEYQTNLCIQEKTYSDINMTSFWHQVVHYYDDGLRIKSEKSGRQNIVYQIITYTYDISGNLIQEVSQKTDYLVSAPLEYVYRFEYY